MPTPRDPFDEQRLIDLYKDGAGLVECGAAFGHSAVRAREHLTRLGVPIRSLREAAHLWRRVR